MAFSLSMSSGKSSKILSKESGSVTRSMVFKSYLFHILFHKFGSKLAFKAFNLTPLEINEEFGRAQILESWWRHNLPLRWTGFGSNDRMGISFQASTSKELPKEQALPNHFSADWSGQKSNPGQEPPGSTQGINSVICSGKPSAPSTLCCSIVGALNAI